MAGVNNLRQIICSNVSIEYEISGSVGIFTKKMDTYLRIGKHTHTHESLYMSTTSTYESLRGAKMEKKFANYRF
jgi:hypothetical protein